eukprot:jgi/Hompol1/1727/HPOL_004948-RA
MSTEQDSILPLIAMQTTDEWTLGITPGGALGATADILMNHAPKAKVDLFVAQHLLPKDLLPATSEPYVPTGTLFPRLGYARNVLIAHEAKHQDIAPPLSVKPTQTVTYEVVQRHAVFHPYGYEVTNDSNSISSVLDTTTYNDIPHSHGAHPHAFQQLNTNNLHKFPHPNS